MTTKLNKDNFDEVTTKNEIVIIDFWAEWCGPCKTFAPIFEAAAEEYPQIVFAKVNIEEEPELANDFSIRSIPLLMVLKQGVIIFAEAGTMPKSGLIDLVNQAQAADMQAVHQQIKDSEDSA